MNSLRIAITTFLLLFTMTALVACNTASPGTDPNDPTNGITNPDASDGIESTPALGGDGDDTDTMTDTEMMTDTDMMTDTEMMTDTDMMTPTMEADATAVP